MIPGQKIELGGRDWILPPINAASFKQHKQELAAAFAGNLPDMELIAQLIFEALRRNYQEIRLEDCLEWVDAGNFISLFEIVANTSGMVRQVGEMMGRLEKSIPAPTSTSSSPT